MMLAEQLEAIEASAKATRTPDERLLALVAEVRERGAEIDRLQKLIADACPSAEKLLQRLAAAVTSQARAELRVCELERRLQAVFTPCMN